jgi:hypothetical protein
MPLELKFSPHIKKFKSDTYDKGRKMASQNNLLSDAKPSVVIRQNIIFGRLKVPTQN